MQIVHEKITNLKGLSKPRKNFMAKIFSTVLSLRGKANYLNLNRYADCNEKTIRRNAQQTFHFEALNTQLASESLGKSCILAMDATFVSKSGKKTFGLDRFWNRSTSRVERGLEVSVLALVDDQRHAMALSARQTPVLANEESRMTFYLQQLKESLPFLPAGLLSLSALNLAKADALQDHESKQPFVFSMQSQKYLAFNEHLLDCFISKFDIDRTLIQSYPAYPEFRKYRAIAS